MLLQTSAAHRRAPCLLAGRAAAEMLGSGRLFGCCFFLFFLKNIVKNAGEGEMSLQHEVRAP